MSETKKNDEKNIDNEEGNLKKKPGNRRGKSWDLLPTF